MKSSKVTKGSKFNYNFTTPFGKKVTQVLTVISNDGTWVLFDNGDRYPLIMVS